MATLLVTETAALRECEAVIEKGMGTFVEVGQALARIRDGRLYRDTHKTFEAYTQQRWGHDRTWASRLIKGAEVVKTVAHGQQKPPVLPNERQARALAESAEEDQADIWGEVVEEAEEAGEKVTAKKVAEKVAEKKAEPEPEPEADPDPIDEALADPWWGEAGRTIARISKELDERSQRALLRPLLDPWVGRVLSDLRSVKATIHQAAPVCRCPRCKGLGCRVCLNTGLLTRGAKRSLEAAR